MHSTIKSQVNARIPTHAQILDWTSVILDAHFTQLVLTKEMHPLLKELQSIISEEVDMCDNIETIPGRIIQMRGQKALPTKKMETYCIEVIDF